MTGHDEEPHLAYAADEDAIELALYVGGEVRPVGRLTISLIRAMLDWSTHSVPPSSSIAVGLVSLLQHSELSESDTTLAHQILAELTL